MVRNTFIQTEAMVIQLNGYSMMQPLEKMSTSFFTVTQSFLSKVKGTLTDIVLPAVKLFLLRPCHAFYTIVRGVRVAHTEDAFLS